jgi:hypothetical protein
MPELGRKSSVARMTSLPPTLLFFMSLFRFPAQSMLPPVRALWLRFLEPPKMPSSTRQNSRTVGYKSSGHAALSRVVGNTKSKKNALLRRIAARILTNI